MSQPHTNVLTIAGFDPSAGAGVLSDIKTIEANGAYGLGVVSALTWQNDAEFDGVEWLPVHKIISQTEVLLRRINIRFVKVGLIENLAVLQELLSFLTSRLDQPVIIYDPILKASAGFEFHNFDQSALEDMWHQLYCITPNIPEATQLFGHKLLHEELLERSNVVNILLKGGHADEQTCTDILYSNGRAFHSSNPRLEKGSKHGSGCVLSSALTAQLALGNYLPEAAENANTYTHQFLASNETLLGYHTPFDLCIR
jgi:hydroxymethylpyrimidine/phosphomethylpyrimidine kinase